MIKEMWSVGWWSRVAILRMNGRVLRMLIFGMMSRPSGTAREPDCIHQAGGWRCTGGQKSFCMSTMMRAEVWGLKGGMA